jgi:hypothetical protein
MTGIKFSRVLNLMLKYFINSGAREMFYRYEIMTTHVGRGNSSINRYIAIVTPGLSQICGLTKIA